MDENQDGRVSFREFIVALAKLVKENKMLDCLYWYFLFLVFFISLSVV
jgi:hypothetical protein